MFFDVIYNITNNELSLVSLLLSIGTACFVIFRWLSDKKQKKEYSRRQFFQNLIDGFSAHNVKFLEHWDNKGFRPGLEETIPIEDDKEAFGKRIVTLSHLNILLQFFFHKKILNPEDFESIKHWANRWFDSAEEQLKIIMKYGDIYPIDFLKWLYHEVFYDENSKTKKLANIMGLELKNRID